MATRNARVSALSDKIQGLKFMQRGAGVTPSTSSSSLAAASADRGSTSKQTSASSSGTNNRPRRTDDDDGSPAGDVDDADNDERWVMPHAVRLLRRAAKRQKKREASGVTVTSEPGWHAWLGRQTGVQTLEEAADGLHELPDDDAAAALVSSLAVTRRSFGAWAASDGKKGKRGGGAAKGDDESEDDSDVDSQFSFGNEDDGERDGSRSIQKTGFIKPGYLSGDKDGSKRKDNAAPAARGNVNNKGNVSAVAARGGGAGQQNKRKSDSDSGTPKRKRKPNDARFDDAAPLKGFEG